uniref:PP1-binding domain-containing protein n=1 Tax=Loa loa TaxID=7209 RepID=A0A1I7V8G7_LOALO
MNFQPEKPKNGVLVDRCDRWTAKILEDFPVIQTNDTFSRSVLPTVQNSDGGGKMMRDTPSRYHAAAVHPYLSPIMRSHKCEILETSRQLYNVVPESVGLEITPKASNFPTSPVCDRRISNYERILPKEDLENVHRLLQTPTPRRRYAPGIQAEDSFASLSADQFSPIPLPASILKTRKGRQEENASSDVTESRFKNLRFDLSNSFVSNCDRYDSGGRKKCECDPPEMNCANFLDVRNPDAFHFTDMNKEVFLEKHLELQDGLKILLDKDEESESMDAANQETPCNISVEEQSDSDMVEDQERRGEGNEKIERYFEKQEIKDPHGKTEPSVMRNENLLIRESLTAPVSMSYEEQEEIEDLDDKIEPSVMRNENPLIRRNCTAPVPETYDEQEKIKDPCDKTESSVMRNENLLIHGSFTAPVSVSYEEQEEVEDLDDKTEPSVMKNENFLIRESFTAPVSVTYEEQEDPGIPLDADVQDIVSDVHTEGKRNLQDAGCLPESTSVLTTTKITRHTATFEVKISPRPPKKLLGSLSDEMAAESEDDIASTVSESLQKKVSYEQEDETDPTSTEIEKAMVFHLEMNKKFEEEEDRMGYSPVLGVREILSEQASSTVRDAEVESSKLVHPSRRRHRSEKEDPTNGRQAFRTFSSDSFQSSSSDSETSTSSHRMLTRSAAKAMKLASLSPKVKMKSRKRLESGTSSSRSRETTPRRLTRITASVKNSPKIEKTRQKPPESRTSSPHSRETTPRRSTRIAALVKNSPKIEKTPQKRLGSRTSSPHSRETTPRRSTRVTSSARSSPITGKTRRKRLGSRTSSSCSRETTPKRLTRATSLSKSSPKIEGIQRQRLESGTSLAYSREVTPEQSVRPTASVKNSPTRKSVCRTRTQSEQTGVEETIPGVISKASPNRRRRAASEESQLSEISIKSYPVLTRPTRKAKSENGSPPKQRTVSGFEPTLEKIDEAPKKTRLRVGRKTVAQVLEEKMK